MHIFFQLIFHLTEYSIVPITMIFLVVGNWKKAAPVFLGGEALLILGTALVRTGIFVLPIAWSEIFQLTPLQYLSYYFWIIFLIITYIFIKSSYEIDWVNGSFCFLVGYCSHELYMGILCLIMAVFPITEAVDAALRLFLAAGIITVVVRVFREKMVEKSLDTLRKKHGVTIICLVGCFLALFQFTIMTTISTVSYFDLTPKYSSGTTIMLALSKQASIGSMLKDIFEMIIVLLALHTVLEYGETDFEHELFLKLYEQEKVQYQQFQQNVDYINSRYHDLKHCLTLLSKDRDSAERLLDDVSENIAFLKTEVDTGSETLDNIITDRQMLCHSKNIEFHFMTDGTDFSWIDSIDLYIIFCNMLDNAIEYLESSDDERTIQLGIRTIRQMVFIHQENSIKSELAMDGRYPASTKGEAHNHGFGIKSIAAAVERYGGTIKVAADRGKYELNIYMPKP